MSYMPYVYEERPGGVERAYDLPSRLLKDRIILLVGEFNQEQARSIMSQLLFLNSQGHDPIKLYINSQGGSITDGMAILDTMKMIESPVHTICTGLAASMGAFILACGDKRYALPNSEIMIHQPLGGAQGQASDIEITAKRIIRIKERLAKYLAFQTKQDLEKVMEDMERDKWFYPDEAKDYGLIDEILPYKKEFLYIAD